MWSHDLEIQLERLQHSKGLAYRAGLAGLLAAYGRGGPKVAVVILITPLLTGAGLAPLMRAAG